MSEMPRLHKKRIASFLRLFGEMMAYPIVGGFFGGLRP